MRDLKTPFMLWLAAVGFRISHYVIFADSVVAGSDAMQNIKLARQFAFDDIFGGLDTYWSPVYPMLIGIVTYFVNDLILPAIIVSIIAGSLAAPLTYCLVKQSYGQREAVIAAVIAVFYPNLINSVFAIGTENVYLVWIIGALIVGWKGWQRNFAPDYLLTGILLGLAYLTRPEAIGYLLFFVLLIFSKNWRRRKVLSRSSLEQIAALLLGFAILAAPYILYLRSAAGAWTVSGKAAVNMSIAEMPEDAALHTPPPTFSKQRVSTAILSFALSLREVHKSFTNLLSLLLLIFAALGLFGDPWNKNRLKREMYLFLFCLLTVCGYAASAVLDRYFYVLLPIFFGWIARGIVHLEHKFHQSLQNWLPNKFFYLLNFKSFVIGCLILIYLYVLPVNFYVRSSESAWQSAASEQRDAGLWLKANAKASPIIFSENFRPVFYAEGKQFWTSATDPGEISRQIKENRVDFVVASERSLKDHSYLQDFTETLLKSPEFELVYEKNEPPGYRISIFALK